MENNFKDSDKQKVVEFLNFVANHATYQMTTQEAIKFYGLLSYMQKELLPKIDDNILEVKQVINHKEEK